MSEVTILKATGNAISSPGSAAGLSPCGSPESKTMSRSGPDHVHVSRFRSRDSDKAMPTNDTSGPLFTASSPSAALQSSLENRLRQRMDVNGSPLFVLMWKTWDMPAGPPICRLAPSKLPISGRAFGGWPTPMAGTPAQKGYNEAGNNDSSRKTVELCPWPTPMSRDTRSGETGGTPLDHNARPLNEVALLASWPTPNTPSGGPNAKSTTTHTGGMDLEGAATLLGPISSGSNAQTEKRGRLNPAFSLWLMGFPTEWVSCGVRVTPSSRKSRRNSS